jgi:hypothetical protein
VLPDQGHSTPQAAVIDEYGTMVKWLLAWGNPNNLVEKLAPFPLRPPQIPQEVTLGLTRRSAVISQRLTPLDMALLKADISS